MKLPAPALPASTNVVVALATAMASASTAERRAAPIDVGVQVDQAGHDEATGRVDHLARRGRCQPVADGGDLAVGEADIRDAVDAAARIEHATTGDHPDRARFSSLP